MARRRVTAEVDIDADGARSGAAETEKSAGRISQAFDGLKGKAGGVRDSLTGFGDKLGGLAKEKLGPFGDAAEKAGLDLEKMGPAGMVAGAALGGLVTTVVAGINQFRDLAAEVKNYQSAAGLGAEEASRLNAVMKQFGVEAEDGYDVLKTLAEEAGDAPEKFERFGVAIARTASGSVDMTATLKNVADRFREIRDPTERAALGANLFGDTWVKIAPILERGGDGLDKLIKSVDDSAIVTEDGIRQADAYQKALADLSTQWKSAQIEIGREALPEIIEGLKNLTAAMNAVNDVADKVGGLGRIKDAFDTITSPIEQARRATDHILDVWRRTVDDGDEVSTVVRDTAVSFAELALKAAPAAAAQQEVADAAARAKDRQAELTVEAEKLADAYEEQKRRADDLTAGTLTIAGTALAAESAQRSLDRAVGDLKVRHEELTTAVNTSGEASDEARAAANNYDGALLSAKQAADQHAQAQVNLAERTAEASGQMFTAEQASIVYRDALVKVRDQATDPTLVAGLDALIGLHDDQARTAGDARYQVDELAAAYSRLKVEAAGATTSNGTIVGSADRLERVAQRAAGGPAMAGQSYLVGEHGPEILTMGATGFVTPPGRSGGPDPGGAPIVVVVQVDGRQMAEASIPHLEQERRSRM